MMNRSDEFNIGVVHTRDEYQPQHRLNRTVDAPSGANPGSPGFSHYGYVGKHEDAPHYHGGGTRR